MNLSRKAIAGFTRHRPAEGLRRWQGPYPLLLCLGLGIMVWAYVDSRRMVTEELAVPLEVQVPPGWLMLKPPPDIVKVKVRGARQVMRTLRAGNKFYILRRIKAPQEQVDSFDRELALDTTAIEGIPQELMVMEVTPAAIPLRLVRLVKKWLPVEAVIVGKPDKGFGIGRIQVDPRGVEAMGPKYLVDQLTPSDTIKTKPLDVSGKRYGAADRVLLEPLVVQGSPLRIDTNEVYVSVQLRENPLERTLTDKVPVRVLLGWPLDKMRGGKLLPPAVELTLRGPELLVSEVKPTDVTVYVDTREMLPTTRGSFTLKCHALVPRKIEVARITPARVTWQPPAPATPAPRATAKPAGKPRKPPAPPRTGK